MKKYTATYGSKPGGPRPPDVEDRNKYVFFYWDNGVSDGFHITLEGSFNTQENRDLAEKLVQEYMKKTNSNEDLNGLSI